MLTQLNIMLEGLKKKASALAEVLSISENQQTVIKSELPLEGVRQLIFDMNEEKQAAVKIVIECDNMFEIMLKDIGQELEATQHLYKPQVKVMQEHIKQVMGLDVKIRVTEEENNRLLDERREKEETKSPESIAPAPPPKPQAKSKIPTNSAQVIKAYQDGAKEYKG